jgi:hypothetical protein
VKTKRSAKDLYKRIDALRLEVEELWKALQVERAKTEKLLEGLSKNPATESIAFSCGWFPF